MLKTVFGETTIVFHERKSKFIAHIKNVETDADAKKYIAFQRKLYHDASHVVYAYIVNGFLQYKRYSDAGEPKGTAGLPVLNVLVNSNMVNVVVTITRYFGGILLGKGGLMRTYARAAQNVIDAAQLIDYDTIESIVVTTDYKHLDEIKSITNSLLIKQFSDIVTLELLVHTKRTPEILSKLNNIPGVIVLTKNH